MLSIRAEFLTGRYVAADPYGHDTPEWPPHPGRLFMAMAAAYFEGGKNDGERSALEWLERRGPPSISYSPWFSCQRPTPRWLERRGPPSISYDNSSAFPREIVYHFVPVNDEYFTPGQVSLGTIDLKGGGRLRKERSFPTTVTGPDPVIFAWDDADASAYTESLRAICSKVHRLGHSSSIVHLTVDDNDAQDIDPTLIPSEGGEEKIRWVSPGVLSRFEDAYVVESIKNSQGRPYFARKARLNAIVLRPVSYSTPQGSPRSVPSGQFVDMRIFEILKRPYPRLVHARAISRAVKSKMLANADDPEPISGLDADDRPTTKPHISVVPLAAVRHRRADGKVRGVAIVMPRGLGVGAADAVLRTLWGNGGGGMSGSSPGGKDGHRPSLSLDVSGHGTVELAPYEGDEARTLDSSTWAGVSREWSTVTPIVLDRVPRARGDARDADVSRIISKSCTLQGLPAPVSIATSNVPYLPGPPLSVAFPPYTLPRRREPLAPSTLGNKPAESGDGTVTRVHMHAYITFGKHVRGPIILGAGRYNGYGLCIPWGGM